MVYENILISMTILPLASFFLGIIFNYEIRKISARLQSRIGPWFIVPRNQRKRLGTTRLFQPLYDALKLLCKETIIPKTAKIKIFKASPYIALISLIVSTMLIPIAWHSPFASFELSLVAILYLLLAIPFSFILGGSVSSSPWGIVGSQREAELMLAYETPIVISAFTAAIMANTLSIQGILEKQLSSYPFIFLNPFAAAAMIFGIVGKLHLKPFDIPEAEVEVVAGPTTEYSGKLLGIIEIDKIIITSVLVCLYVDLFLTGGALPGQQKMDSILIIVFLLECFIVISLVTLIHTLNPRLRIDQALRWYLKTPLILAIVGLLWAYIIQQIFPTIL
jgi:NADH-quinone oxidoreductase subunit H